VENGIRQLGINLCPSASSLKQHQIISGARKGCPHYQDKHLKSETDESENFGKKLFKSFKIFFSKTGSKKFKKTDFFLQNFSPVCLSCQPPFFLKTNALMTQLKLLPHPSPLTCLQASFNIAVSKPE
jgi:hypothetical protein